MNEHSPHADQHIEHHTCRHCGKEFTRLSAVAIEYCEDCEHHAIDEAIHKAHNYHEGHKASKDHMEELRQKMRRFTHDHEVDEEGE